jgi:hypothetical protein
MQHGCMRTCMYVCMCLCVWPNLHSRGRAINGTWPAQMRTCMYVRTYVCDTNYPACTVEIEPSTARCPPMCVYLRMYVYMYVCVYVFDTNYPTWTVEVEPSTARRTRKADPPFPRTLATRARTHTSCPGWGPEASPNVEIYGHENVCVRLCVCVFVIYYFCNGLYLHCMYVSFYVYG